MNSREIRSRWIVLGLLASTILLPGTTCDQDIGKGDEFGEVTSRASLRLGDIEGSGSSQRPSISFDGRFVAFQTAAPDLADNDTNGKIDIVVKDRLTGTLERASVVSKSPLFQPTEDALNPSISADGNFVAMESISNLGGIGLGVKLIWVRDRAGDSTDNAVPEFEFSDRTGVPVAKDSVEPSISADGKFVAFLASGDVFDHSGGALRATNPIKTKNQVYVADLSVTPHTLMLASAAIGFPTRGCNDHCFAPRMINTAAGPAVAFYSPATDLHASDTDTTMDVYLSFPQPLGGAAPTIELLSIGVDDLKGIADNYNPAITPDGRFVAFRTKSTNMGGAAIVRRERGIAVGGTIPVVTVLGGPGAFRGLSSTIDISADGTLIAFAQRPDDFYGIAFQQFQEQYFLQQVNGPLTLVSRSTIGEIANSSSGHVVISGDGRWGAWDSIASNLVPDDRLGYIDVFVRGPLR